VGWSGGDGATSYRYRLNGTEVIPSAEDGVTSTATFDGLTSETSYSIVVIAIKASSFGDLTASSDPLTVTTISNLEIMSLNKKWVQ
jgi:vacuolar-type H+-ATPase subunit F/Vma7